MCSMLPYDLILCCFYFLIYVYKNNSKNTHIQLGVEKLGRMVSDTGVFYFYVLSHAKEISKGLPFWNGCSCYAYMYVIFVCWIECISLTWI